jgi:hypothetical protein
MAFLIAALLHGAAFTLVGVQFNRRSDEPEPDSSSIADETSVPRVEPAARAHAHGPQIKLKLGTADSPKFRARRPSRGKS